MDYNYHTHTFRCRHAKGSMEEYVLRAIEGGIKYMGFSDHVPFRYPTGQEAFFRVPIAEVGDYMDEAVRLREKYRDVIEIKIGFEMEYYAPHFEQMLSEAVKYGAEYLILGQHHPSVENAYPNEKSSFSPNITDEDLIAYVESVVAAIDTGVFTYIAHPDAIRYGGSLELYEEQMSKICAASVKMGTPLELNFLGIRSKRAYPREDFWRLVGRFGCPVTFGFDAHDVQSAYDCESLSTAMEIVKLYNLNYIGKPELRPII